ncbi:ATP-dependent helicase [Microbacterium sp. LRZ72]|uniref:ATP-dependent DNA helicase n=1 Tax=Microbacterium sp. LRZ72 TaxID=2942481 RepID=UPI0029AF308D|nr:ATP-dependent DNA helicase [Microbacterium sp. LRZ72]MDX2375739.1 ATP-dependent helicase [Microbacterium sp. LRZ72]
MTGAHAPRVPAEALAIALGQFPPTPEQAAVIESEMRPALVIAGAGSGKTETMAGRVVWLVANGLVRRDQILGLTFTRKAAGELAERIRRRLDRLEEFERRGLLDRLAQLHAEGRLRVFGEIERRADAERDEAARAGRGTVAVEMRADAARRAELERLAPQTAAVGGDLLHRPTVATYNSFADQIVREHAVLLGRDAQAAVLSESAAWLLMRRVVLDSDDPRLEERREALSTIIDGALRIARDGVDNLASLEQVRRFADSFAQVLERPSEKALPGGVYRDIREAAEKVGGLPVLTALAESYQQEKHRRGVLDYSDQVAGAFEVVRAHPAVSAELRARYRVVLLDEYQDTSVVQTRLLAETFAGEPVMAVGDPHQSIYGWRGASAGNLGGFAAAFAAEGGAGEYALMTSWRNSEVVLRAANAVLAPLSARSPVAVPPLRARPAAPAGELEVAFEADVAAEAARVADWFARVRAERGERGKATRGAILFRSKKHMQRFADALAARGIPRHILGLGGLLSTPEVVDVVSALRVVDDPGAGSALIRLLGGPRWAIGLADLRRLEALARRIARHDHALQPLADGARDDGEDGGSIIEALDFVGRVRADHGWLQDFTDVARERLRDAALVFQRLRRATALPISELVRMIEIELRLDIELAANEAHGPARVASAQVRAFGDEVHAFLAADERGTVASLLAWLDHAEQRDEFAPRTEPPEDDVVQLLTIHGAKGLEWDAVAVVRMVEGELPVAPRETRGWLGFGVLPYDFRGDAPWLPRLAWHARDCPTQQDLRDAIGDFVRAHRERQGEEERRLAYVAITRARDHLLLTGASWSGTRKPREPSPYLGDVCAAAGLDAPDPDPGENPETGEARTLVWPMDPLGVAPRSRRDVVERAAAQVHEAAAGPRARPTRELALLLAEREEDAGARAPVDAPARIPASRFKDYVTDYGGTIGRISRPLPERPHRQTRLGTLFHAWVEHRSGRVGTGAGLDDGLWEADEESVVESARGREDAEDLARLREIFEASEWATLRPIEVETEIDFALGTGSDERIVVCKLDAVYRRDDRGGRIEIVDWKTGRAPRTPAERDERMLQPALYRLAYHRARGVPLDEIDVVLYYIADDVVIRDDRVYSEEELAQRWNAAREAR